jgi:Family of unknown function (DUF6600)
MRKNIGIFFVLIAVAAFWAASAAAAPVSVSVSFFHDQLAPHGRWVVAGSYGNCWVPSGVAVGWEPYVDGEWVYSDYGWTWVSDDPWGDIPYHYGTWAWVDPYGWVWVPGTVWAPAWVTWAYTDDYIGWAPVPPSFALTATGYFGSPVVVTATHYVFVPTRQFVGVRVATVRVPAQQSVTIFPRTVKTTRFEVSHGVVRAAGPPETHVARVVGHPIERVSVDRLRARPTSLAAGGVTAAKTVRVVAPEKERASLAEYKPAAESRGGQKKEARPATTSARAQSEPKHEASAEKKRETAPRETSAKHEPKPKPVREVGRSETQPRKAEVERSQAAPLKPKAKVEHHSVEPEKARASAGKPHPQPQAQPKENDGEKHSDPRASVNGERASRPAEQKPKEKPKPVKEKERPPKDSSDKP